MREHLGISTGRAPRHRRKVNDAQRGGPQSRLRYASVMFGLPIVALAIFTVDIAFVPTPARADENDHSPWPALRAAFGSEESLKPGTSVLQAHNGGVIDGEVVAVDHRAGTLSVQTQHRGRIDVIVLPSTNIQDSKNRFHTIADVARGDRVEVFVSQRGPSYIAQIINLR
jgi:hypothetical protein